MTIPKINPQGRPYKVPTDDLDTVLKAPRNGWHYPIIYAGAASMESANPNLMTINLGSGDVDGFSISPAGDTWGGGHANYDPQTWLGAGYDGVRFVGEGIDTTTIIQASWDAITIGVKQHNGIVQFEDCTIEGGRPYNGRGIWFGLPTTSLAPNFRLVCKSVRFNNLGPDDPIAGSGRCAWPVFSYQADLCFLDCVWDGLECTEHNIYAHGFAGLGLHMARCTHNSSGAECVKVRSDNLETIWAGPDVAVNIVDCHFENWRQDWSNRGGAAIVMQGAAAHIMVARCGFWPGPTITGGTLNEDGYTRSQCIMISAEGISFDIDTGVVDAGHGNGFVWVTNCLMESSMAAPGLKPIINTGTWGGTQIPCKGYLIQECGVWGTNMHVRANGVTVPVPKWGIMNCNTDRIVTIAQRLGMTATDDSLYSGTVPMTTNRPYGP